jgi:hypothetical protein
MSFWATIDLSANLPDAELDGRTSCGGDHSDRRNTGPTRVPGQSAFSCGCLINRMALDAA